MTLVALIWKRHVLLLSQPPLVGARRGKRRSTCRPVSSFTFHPDRARDRPSPLCCISSQDQYFVSHPSAGTTFDTLSSTPPPSDVVSRRVQSPSGRCAQVNMRHRSRSSGRPAVATPKQSFATISIPRFPIGHVWIARCSACSGLRDRTKEHASSRSEEARKQIHHQESPFANSHCQDIHNSDSGEAQEGCYAR